jgi:hypothetical protein
LGKEEFIELALQMFVEEERNGSESKAVTLTPIKHKLENLSTAAIEKKLVKYLNEKGEGDDEVVNYDELVSEVERLNDEVQKLKKSNKVLRRKFNRASTKYRYRILFMYTTTTTT